MTRDHVSASLHDAVLRRDRICVAARLGFDHTCRDAWGRAHGPGATNALSLEHVKDQLRMGVRAESDLRHLIAVCHFINAMPPTKAMREAFREYLQAKVRAA